MVKYPVHASTTISNMTTMAWEDLINKALQTMVYQVDRPTTDQVGSKKHTRRPGGEYLVAVAVNDIDNWMLC